MEDIFEILNLDDEFESEFGKGYVVSLKLLNHKNEGLDYYNYAFNIDEEDYNDCCWRADISIDNSDVADILSYVSNDGSINEYKKISKSFKNKIINKIRL